jgi:hypothetical protein
MVVATRRVGCGGSDGGDDDDDDDDDDGDGVTKFRIVSLG